jgi:hypothetical protein
LLETTLLLELPPSLLESTPLLESLSTLLESTSQLESTLLLEPLPSLLESTPLESSLELLESSLLESSVEPILRPPSAAYGCCFATRGGWSLLMILPTSVTPVWPHGPRWWSCAGNREKPGRGLTSTLQTWSVPTAGSF